MDVQSMTVVTITGTEDEDPAEYLDGHEDVGELLDPLVDGAETDETMKAKQRELDRLAEFGVRSSTPTKRAAEPTTLLDPLVDNTESRPS